MLVHLPQVLTPDRVAAIEAALAQGAFVDGRQTAENDARNAKRNLQLDARADLRHELSRAITGTVMRNTVFLHLCLPKRLTEFHFSRYEPGMTYGEHMDNTVMALGTEAPIRADLSMTLFLAPPESYDGGELVVTSDTTPRPIKLAAGDAVVYPTTDHHLVRPVTRGVRRVAVCWIQSLVRGTAERQILAETWHVLDELYKMQPADKLNDNPAFKALSKARLNLLRLWVEA